MPIYEYLCKTCSEQHEIMQKMNDPPIHECPSCNAPTLQKLVSSSAFHLKGTGWYVTDFRDQDKNKKKSPAEEKNEKPANDAEANNGTKQDASSDSSTNKTAPKATDTTTDTTTKTADKNTPSSSNQ